MSDVFQLGDFLKNVFSGLYNLTFGSDDNKGVFFIVVPIIVISLLVAFLDFIFPSLLDIRQGKIDTKIRTYYKADMLRSVNFHELSVRRLLAFKPKYLKKTRFLEYNDRMHLEGMKKLKTLFIQDQFAQIYGFKANRLQIMEFQEFYKFTNSEFQQWLSKNRKRKDVRELDDKNNPKDDNDDKKDNIIDLHSA